LAKPAPAPVPAGPFLPIPETCARVIGLQDRKAVVVVAARDAVHGRTEVRSFAAEKGYAPLAAALTSACYRVLEGEAGRDALLSAEIARLRVELADRGRPPPLAVDERAMLADAAAVERLFVAGPARRLADHVRALVAALVAARATAAAAAGGAGEEVDDGR
jgi:hypothetical protein